MSGQANWLLNKHVGWRAAQLDHVSTTGDTAGLQLVALPGHPRPLTDAQGSFGGFALATGIATDNDGNIYILDRSSSQIKKYDICSCTFEMLPCIAGPGAAPRRVNQPTGLAISNRGDLYVTDRGNRRIQIFALKGLPLRAILGPMRVISDSQGIHVSPTKATVPMPDPTSACIPDPIWADGTWEPYDVELNPYCIAYISDYANGLIHIIDAGGRWLRALDPGLEKPTDLALDREGNLYVVQEGKDFVLVLDKDGKVQGQITQPATVKGKFCPINIAVDNAGNLYVTDKLTRCVHIYCGDGCGGLCHSGTLGGDAYGSALAFDAAGNPLLCDSAQGRILCFEPPASYPTTGTFLSDALDSEIYQCEWHRILLRAQVPAGAAIRVDTFTSESLKSTAEVASLPASRWGTGQLCRTVDNDVWDCLIASARGRYLWLKVTLIGDGTATPLVEWLRVYYPRSSSLQYLPAVYSEDPAGRAFLDHYLSITDTLTDAIGERITNIARYFDPMATPAQTKTPGGTDFLSWLAGWLDLTLDRHWDEARRRQLVKRAYELYRRRGTPEGVRLHLELYLGLEPRLLEHFRVRRWLFLNHGRLGDATALWGEGVVKRLHLDGTSRIGEFQLTDNGDPLRDPFYTYAHLFTVFVPTRTEPTETQMQTVARIVEMSKPAHAMGRIEWVQPRFRIGIQSFVGVDTVVGEYPEGVIAGQGKLGYDTILGPSADEQAPPTMRIGSHTRIGSSTLID